jgi:hypothetical protein
MADKTPLIAIIYLLVAAGIMWLVLSTGSESRAYRELRLVLGHQVTQGHIGEIGNDETDSEDGPTGGDYAEYSFLLRKDEYENGRVYNDPIISTLQEHQVVTIEFVPGIPKASRIQGTGPQTPWQWARHNVESVVVWLAFVSVCIWALARNLRSVLHAARERVRERRSGIRALAEKGPAPVSRGATIRLSPVLQSIIGAVGAPALRNNPEAQREVVARIMAARPQTNFGATPINSPESAPRPNLDDQ